ncbi:hypothetical protein AB0C08_34710 [Microbispora bryophytorum]|uniref:hypothetical protein n=1 Tax=Microbispora bryophytorum TaxID=1460882 RepID=UPI0033F63582
MTRRILAVILAMLAVDLFAHRRAHVVGVREALAWSGVWIALGLSFGVVVWLVWATTTHVRTSGSGSAGRPGPCSAAGGRSRENRSETPPAPPPWRGWSQSSSTLVMAEA